LNTIGDNDCEGKIAFVVNCNWTTVYICSCDSYTGYVGVSNNRHWQASVFFQSHPNHRSV